jgi:hypothetical protein
MEASLEIPLTPNITVMVYTLQMSNKIRIVIVVVEGIPKTTDSALVSNGVAKEKVVAVAHTIANTAVISMTCPKIPSTLSPNKGRIAS